MKALKRFWENEPELCGGLIGVGIAVAVMATLLILGMMAVAS